MEKAIESRDMQVRMADPTDEKLKLMVSSKIIDNCYVVASDVTNSRTLFGPNRPGLRGETVRQRPEGVIPEYLDIPRDFYQLNHFFTLNADVILVNGLPFLTEFLRDIGFGTTEHIPYCTDKQLANSLMKVVKLYDKGGFVVLNVLMDGKFDKFNPEISLIELIISAARGRVAEIERYHCTLK